MKRVNFGIIVLLLAMVTTTCTKEELLPSDNENPILKAAIVENVVVINPTEGDDNQNIIDAFEEAKALGDGSTVFFSEGVFHISEPIGIANFSGTVRGAGMNKTFIKDLNEAPFPIMSEEYPIEIGGGKWASSLITFYSEPQYSPPSLNISDMTFCFEGLTVPHIKPWHYYETDFIQSLVAITGVIDGQEDVEEINANVHNVHFKGVFNDEFVWGVNVHDPLGIVGEPVFDVEGNYLWYDLPFMANALIEKCRFSATGIGLHLWIPKNCVFLIKENDFENALIYNLYTCFCENSQLDIYKNTFSMERGNAIEIYNHITRVPLDYYQIASNILIHQNEFKVNGIADGLWLIDLIYNYFDKKTINAKVRSNKFFLNTSWGGIVNLSSSDANIANNIFSGNASYGVDASAHIYGSYYDVKNMILLGNNFMNLDIEDGTVLLGPYSTNCTVVGGDNTLVCDEGTNNILSGVAPVNTLGRSIKDALDYRIMRIHPSFDPVE